MKTALLPALTLALILSACGSTGTPAQTGDPAPLADVSTQTEVGGAVASDVEQTLGSLSDVGGLGSMASCRAPDSATSTLDAGGRPVDSDSDGVPDQVTWVFTNCARGGATVNGRAQLSDPSTDAALAGSFVDTAQGLTLAYTRADGTTRTAVRTGTSTGTLRNRTDLTIVRNIDESVTDSAHPNRQATWKNLVTVQFTAASGQTIDRRSALPAGTVAVNGPREWHITAGSKQVDRYLQITTTTPIAYDPTCTTKAERIFGTSHARSGAFQVQVYGEAAHTTLLKTITVTYTDCAPTIGAS